MKRTYKNTDNHKGLMKSGEEIHLPSLANLSEHDRLWLYASLLQSLNQLEGNAAIVIESIVQELLIFTDQEPMQLDDLKALLRIRLVA